MLNLRPYLCGNTRYRATVDSAAPEHARTWISDSGPTWRVCHRPHWPICRHCATAHVRQLLSGADVQIREVFASPVTLPGRGAEAHQNIASGRNPQQHSRPSIQKLERRRSNGGFLVTSQFQWPVWRKIVSVGSWPGTEVRPSSASGRSRCEAACRTEKLSTLD